MTGCCIWLIENKKLLPSPTGLPGPLGNWKMTGGHLLGASGRSILPPNMQWCIYITDHVTQKWHHFWNVGMMLWYLGKNWMANLATTIEGLPILECYPNDPDVMMSLPCGQWLRHWMDFPLFSWWVPPLTSRLVVGQWGLAARGLHQGPDNPKSQELHPKCPGISQAGVGSPTYM